MSNQLMILNDVNQLMIKSIDDDAKSIDVLKWCEINWWSQIDAKSIDDLKLCQIYW